MMSMIMNEIKIVEKLKEAGNRLLNPPSSRDELLRCLEELEIMLSKVDQAPSKPIQEALLPSLKALICDRVIKNPDSEIKITVAVCFNEIMRLTAPDSPYDDSRMREIFELIVASFDKLSLLSGVSYSKALSIIDNVAKVRSSVMMLDIGCYRLIIEMFEQFKRNLRLDHPPSVFLAMEEIMSVIIDESEDISLELLKVLLDCVRKENENTSPMSWRLGGKVIKRTSQKLKPFLRDAIKSGDIRKDDYAPFIDSILQADSEIMEQKHVADSTKQLAAEDPLADIPGHASKSVTAAAKPVLSLDTMMVDQDTPANQKSSKASGHFNQSKASDIADMKDETQKENKRTLPNEGREAASKKALTSPRGRPKKSTTLAVKNDDTSKDNVATKKNNMLTNSGEKNHQETSVKSIHSGKKLGRPKKDAAGGSGNKRSSSKLGTSSSERERNGIDEMERKALRRKRDEMEEEEVYETPFGRKKYKEDIVGCRLKVWWPKDKTFYEGIVTSYDPASKKHQVDYEDGDMEILNIVNETFEFIGDEIAVLSSKIDVKPQRSSEERGKKDHSVTKKTETPKSGSKDSIAS